MLKNGQLDISNSGWVENDEAVCYYDDILEQYIEAITARVKLERPLKVVVDCGNGVGGIVAPRLRPI